jgi:N-acetylglucosaminyl-diphospho-decaprenol L-rhamnosyltransferase
VIVVDHGLDGSGRLAAAGGATVLPDPTNPGFGAGQNHGVGETTAPVVLLLNPDADPDPGGIAAGIELLGRDDSVGAVEGVIVDRASGEPERSQGRELGPLHLLGRVLGARRLLRLDPVRRLARRLPPLADHVERVPEAPRPVAALAATALLVRRRAFVAVGGFDESYFLYGEDLDLSRRLRAAGWTLMAVPERFAAHDGGGSSATWTARELAWWGGTMRFAARWWTRSAWRAALVAAALEWAKVAALHPTQARRAWRGMVVEPSAVRRTSPAGARAAVAQSTAAA